MGAFDLLGDSFIRLLGALPDGFSVPGELVPPDAAALVDCHRYEPALPADHDIGRVVRAAKSTANRRRRFRGGIILEGPPTRSFHALVAVQSNPG